MRLIDADALKEDMERTKENLEDWVEHTEGDITRALVRINLYEEFIDLINNTPTIVVRTKIKFEERNNENGKLQRRKG